MLGRKKKENAKTEVVLSESQKESAKFEKNIRLLWIYTSLFCLFAVALIAVSSFIQGKMNSEAEYYQDMYHEATNSNKSALKNIQDENAALKKDLETAITQVEKLESESKANSEIITSASEMIENAEYLIQALVYEDDNKDDEAREELKKIDRSKLSESMLKIYDELSESLK